MVARRALQLLPVPIWGAILSCFCMILGWHWDISWHRSIGRDTVWTLPHIAIYTALAVAFAYSAWLVLSHTFGGNRGQPGIRVLGFTGPSGAFIALWAILLQFAGIVFDDWWHGSYGLDVGVFSPAHAALGTGIKLFYFGQFALAALYRNTLLQNRDTASRWVMMILWAFFLADAAVGVDPTFGHFALRTHSFVITSATAFPFALVLIHTYLDSRWASTITAALYMLLIILLMQVFQLFPAEPKFGPVYHRVANFIPPLFPLVLVIPAFALSLVLSKRGQTHRWVTMLLLGIVFVITFNATNWLSSAFLSSGWADNWFFAGGYPGTVFEAQLRRAPQLGLNLASLVSLGIATLVAAVAAFVGQACGRWLRGVVR